MSFDSQCFVAITHFVVGWSVVLYYDHTHLLFWQHDTINQADIFLAHHLGICKILPWDRKSYLTHAILLRLLREGYIHWLYWNSCTLSSSDVIVMLQ